MTFLDKAIEIENGTNVSKRAIVECSCPQDYDLEKIKDCNRVGYEKCIECWNREMPKEYPYNVQTDKRSEALITEVTEQTQEYYYNQGLADAWELFKKVLEMPNDTICEHILEGDAFNPPLAMVNCLTPQEALAKLKAYEEAQSKVVVGDLVKDNYDDIAVVIDETESYFSVLTKCGCVGEWKKDICKKTGKHIDISSILEQIGE